MSQANHTPHEDNRIPHGVEEETNNYVSHDIEEEFGNYTLEGIRDVLHALDYFDLRRMDCVYGYAITNKGILLEERICTTMIEAFYVSEFYSKNSAIVIYKAEEKVILCCNSQFFIYDFHVVVSITPQFLSRYLLDYDGDYLLAQSGYEDLDVEQFGKSKWVTKINRQIRTKNVAVKTLEEIVGKNFGSKGRKKKKRIMNKYKHIKSQSGIELDPGLGSVSDVVVLIERVVLFYFAAHTDSYMWKAIFSCATLLPTGKLKEFVESMIQLIKQHFGNVSLGSFTDSVKDMLKKWDTFTLNGFAQSFVTFATKVWLNFLYPNFLNIVSDTTMQTIIQTVQSFCSFDFITALLKATVYISNAVNVLVKTGSFSGFMTTETLEDKLNKTFREISSDFILYREGNMEYIAEKSHYEFFFRLSEFQKELENAIKSQVGRTVSETKAMLKTVINMIDECVTAEKHKEARVMPYMAILQSGSGINKTHLMQLIAGTVLRTNNYPHGRDFHHYLNDKDKYVSLWKNYTTCVMCEDSANARITPEVETPLDLANFVIKMGGNLPHTLVAADVESKGKQFNRAVVGVFSTNSTTQNFSQLSAFASTVWRRFRCIITGEVKQQFRKSYNSPSIDYSKIPEEMQEKIAMDAWEFTVRRTVICHKEETKIKDKFNEVEPPDKDDLWAHEIIRHKGMLLKNISLQQLLIFLQEDSLEHFAEQKKVLKVASKVHDDDNWCSCGGPEGSCLCKTGNAIWEPKPHQEIKPVNIVDPLEVDYTNTNEDYLQSLQISEIMEQEQEMRTTRKKKKKINLNKQSGIISKMRTINTFVSKLKMKSRRTEVMELIKEIKVHIENYKSVLCTWFDSFVADVLTALANRVVDVLYDYFTNYTKLVPGQLRKTCVSVALQTFNKSVRVCTFIDYLWAMFRYKWNNSLLYYLLIITYKLKSLEWFLYFIEWKNSLLRLYVWLRYGSLEDGEENEEDDDFSKPDKMQILWENATIYDRQTEDKEDTLQESLQKTALLAYITSIFLPRLSDYFDAMHNVSLQAGLDQTEEEMAFNDLKQEKPFFSYKLEKMLDHAPVTDNIKHTELENLLKKNVVYARSEKASLKGFTCTNALMVGTHLILFPKHFVEDNMGSIITCTRKSVVSSTVAGNAKFQFTLERTKCRDFNKADATLVYVVQTGDVADICKYFPDALVKKETEGRLICRDRLGDIKIIDALNIRSSENLNDERHISDTSEYKPHYPGYCYTSDNYSGLCGAPLIDVSRKQSHVMGIHSAGNSETRFSVSCLILKSELMEYVQHFKGVHLVKQGNFSMLSYGIDLESGTPHPKSPFVTECDRIDGVKLLCGSKNRVTPTSKVVATPIAVAVKEAFKHNFEWGPAPVKGPEGKDKKHAIKRYVQIYAKKGMGFNHDTMMWAKHDYLKPIMQSLNNQRHRWEKEIYVLTEEQNVQGLDGKKYLGAMNMSTSMGKHLPGIKARYAKQDENGKWHFEQFVMDEFRNRDKRIREGYRTYEIFSSNVKSEPTSIEKIQAGKTRIFFAASTHTQLLFRKYLLTTLRFFCTQTETTECAVGINPHSKQWQKIVDYFNEFKGKNYMALDMSNFDILTPTTLIDVALDVLLSIPMQSNNFSDADKLALAVLKQEILHAVVDFNGDVIVIDGIIPSGINITSILGSIVNSLYYRCAYYIIRDGKGLGNFKDAVKLLTFGDDSIAKVSKAHGDINMLSMIDALNSVGIVATNGKKDGNNVKYNDITELEFLKRSFRYDRHFGCYVAALDIKSIYKSLSCLNPPKTINIENITGSNIDGALFEMKFHGRVAYEEFRSKIKTIAEEARLVIYTRCLDITFDEALRAWKNDYDHTLVTKPRDVSVFERLRLCMDAITRSQTWFLDWTQNNEETKSIDLDRSVSKTIASDEATKIVKQSGVVNEIQKIVGFTSSQRAEIVDVGMEDRRNRINDSDASISDFFKRPVKIGSTTWAYGTTLNVGFEVWDLYLSNKRVSNRMNNYMLFKGDLHIKIVVTGNPFYYGKAIAAYQPLATLDDFSQPGATGEDVMVNVSQWPKIWIDPTNSTGGEMVLPFFWPYDYFNLALDDASALGKLYLKQFSGLKHANIATPGVDQCESEITIYAWMENIQLVSPTHKNSLYLTAQSGMEEEDQTVDKPISQFATSIANAARIAGMVPVIKPFATAVEMAATLTSDIASAFGYSKPTCVTSADKMIVRFCANTALTNDVDSCERLTTDAKQQITIDPRTVGLKPVDELSILGIAQHESFLTKFSWDTSYDSMDFLHNFRVGPRLGRVAAVVGPPAYTNHFMTAIAGASFPFQYWTGSIEFRFQIVCSKMHRGKLLLLYDPYATPNATPEVNLQYSQVIDISETNDICVSISNHQQYNWIENSNLPVEALYSGSTFTGAVDYCNGTLSVYCANKLTSPNATAGTSVDVLVFVKAGDDFKVACPRDSFVDWSPLTPQSGTETMDTNERVCINFSEPCLSQDNRVYMGEEISSYRNLLKRYNFVQSDYISSANTFSFHTNPAFPEYRSSTSGVGNLSKTPLLNWLRPAYCGIRGSIRYKILYNSPQAEILVTRIAHSTDSVVDGVLGTTTYKLDMANQPYFSRIANGGVLMEVKNYPVVEFEVPFYHNKKFIEGKRSLTVNSDLDGGYSVYTTRSVAATVYMNTFMAAGEDISLLFFTGWPPMREHYILS